MKRRKRGRAGRAVLKTVGKKKKLYYHTEAPSHDERIYDRDGREYRLTEAGGGERVFLF